VGIASPAPLHDDVRRGRDLDAWRLKAYQMRRRTSESDEPVPAVVIDPELDLVIQ
jgi:hypothetical protein